MPADLFIEEFVLDGAEKLMLVLYDPFFIDMPEGEAFFDEGPADQSAAVALLGFALAAEQDHFQLFTLCNLEPFEAFAEKGLPPDEGIVDFAPAVVAGRIVGSAAQFIAQVDIADALFFQGREEGFAVVLRVVFGVGSGADIGEVFDAE